MDHHLTGIIKQPQKAVWLCLFCEISIHSEKTLCLHVSESKHVSSVNLIMRSPRCISSTYTTSNVTVVAISESMWKCRLCEEVFLDTCSLINHLESEMHVLMVEEMGKTQEISLRELPLSLILVSLSQPTQNISIINMPDHFRCVTCMRTIIKSNEAAHLASKNHHQNIRSFESRLEPMQDKLFYSVQLVNSSTVYCALCRDEIPLISLNYHLKSFYHERSYYKLNVLQRNPQVENRAQLYDRTIDSNIRSISEVVAQCSRCNRYIHMRSGKYKYNNDRIRQHKKSCPANQPNNQSNALKHNGQISTSIGLVEEEMVDDFDTEIKTIISNCADQMQDTIFDTIASALDCESGPSSSSQGKNTGVNNTGKRKPAKHIVTGFHKWEKFSCLLCSVIVLGSSSNFNEHLKSSSHSNNEIKEVNKGHKKARMKTVCDLCRLMLFGSKEEFQKHFENAEHFHFQQMKREEKLIEAVKLERTETLTVTVLDATMKEKQGMSVYFEAHGILRAFIVNEDVISVDYLLPSVSRTVLDHLIANEAKKLLNLGVLTCQPQMGVPKFHLNPKILDVLLDGSKLQKYLKDLLHRSNESERSPVERMKDEEILRFLKETLSRQYPNCEPYIFGSRSSGLTLQRSDLDIFLDPGYCYYGSYNQDSRSQRDIVYKVCDVLKNRVKNLNKIPNARVPIVSFTHLRTGLKCDVSFKNGLSCQNTELIKFYLTLDERVKPVILFVKEWAILHQLHGPPKFSSYALSMLVIFYLQQVKVLPSVTLLQSLHTGRPLNIAGWKCSFCKDVSKIPKTSNTKTLLDLLKGFFNYYYNFNYEDLIISPLSGTPLQRLVMQNPCRRMPHPYNLYCDYLTPQNFASKYPVCILDPFDLTHNLSKSFSKCYRNLLVYLCGSSFTALERAH